MRLMNTNHWMIELTTDELRLVIKALAGRLKDVGEEEEAAELARRISKDRAHASKQAHVHADQLLDNITSEEESLRREHEG